MVKFLPDKLTDREVRALERLSKSADATGISPAIQSRLQLLGFAEKHEDDLVITCDGMLQLYICKTMPEKP